MAARASAVNGKDSLPAALATAWSQRYDGTVKVCPACGLSNVPSATHCDCGHDLTGVPLESEWHRPTVPELGHRMELAMYGPIPKGLRRFGLVLLGGLGAWLSLAFAANTASLVLRGEPSPLFYDVRSCPYGCPLFLSPQQGLIEAAAGFVAGVSFVYEILTEWTDPPTSEVSEPKP